jgi:glycosyltransferase involved in cell wall biosynthesis
MKDILVVIPCYRASQKINNVVIELESNGFTNIVVVDDCCPDSSTSEITSDNVVIVSTEINSGVGGAFLHGVKYVFTHYPDKYSEIKFIAKIDADGQHSIIDLIKMYHFMVDSKLDLLKGNRYLLGANPLRQPFIRKAGNVGLTFFTKMSTGYWNVGDPVNGMLIFNLKFIKLLTNFPIANRYLFESSVLYFSSMINAKIQDFPNNVVYADEHSSLSISNELPKFLKFHFECFVKRIVRDYIYPNFDFAILGFLGSLALPIGIFGSLNSWMLGLSTNSQTEFGIIAFNMLLIIIGYMSVIFFMQRDRLIREHDYAVNELL